MAADTVQYKDFAGVTQIAGTSNPSSNIQIVKHVLTEATNSNIQAVKAASTAAAKTDPAAVVAISPNDPKVYLEVGATAAAAANNQTLTGTASTSVYLAGFIITGLGATGASTIAITITGLTNTLTFYLPIVAGATTAITPMNIQFIPPLQASAVNTPVVVNVPSFGAGNTTSSAVAYGYYV